MKVEISDVGSTRKEMKVVVTSEEVNEVTNEIYKDLSQKVVIKGFRKGKAPRDIVRMYYSDYIKTELSKKLVHDKFEQAAKERDLFIVSMPEITNDEPKENEDFTFTAKFDVRPEVVPQKYTGFALKKTRFAVEDKNVDDVLARLRETYADVKDVEDPAYEVEEGNYVVTDLICDEDPRLNRTKMTVEAGVRSPMPGLDKAVLGMHAGEEKTTSMDFPEDHFMEDMKGKSFQVRLKVEGIKTKELPELDDEFAKKTRQEVETLDELKDRIRKDLAERLEADVRTSLEHQIGELLMKENPFEIPESLIRLQAAMMIQGMSRRLSAQGYRMEDLYPDTESLRQDTMSSAENIVRISLLIEAIAKIHGIEAADEDINEELGKLAERYGMPVETVREGMEERGGLDEIKFGIMEKKVYNYIIENSQVEEVDQEQENADGAGSDRS